ncbi:related to rat apoptosis protein RP-8 [Cephalotrichum gorgonifer]|uniref:Related to rat apoptosis protein RP-8 n=1 Tax=Cephalotrichum gorgonifer TaxID=2041049 RepID=A0AAE8N3R7_9PEZI|nr:related to rat apoptosis protein RP-8 [Cephalotrichum gorgonifer]
MSDYDSDSSQGDYTETTTLLGYVSRDPADEGISRLGGQPEWIDPESPPSAALARCGACGDIMPLLLQLNGELPERFPGHERWLYVFGCPKAKCRRKEGGIRAVRAIRVSKEVAEAAREAKRKEEEERKEIEEKNKQEREKQAGLGSALFGSGVGGGLGAGANPFSSGGSNPFSSGAAVNPFSAAPKEKKEVAQPPSVSISGLDKTFAETLSLNNTQAEKKQTPAPVKAEPWPEASALPKPYPALPLVDVDYETLDTAPLALPEGARVEMEEAVMEEAGPATSGKDEYESTMDHAFQKFADRMSQNPEQVIRYEFAGQPVVYSKEDAVARALETGVPRCKGCGAERVFEIQLTPHAITELEADEMSLEGMDWGTVIVEVCKEDCQAAGVQEGEVGYVEEWVGVQWEELVQ